MGLLTPKVSKEPECAPVRSAKCTYFGLLPCVCLEVLQAVFEVRIVKVLTILDAKTSILNRAG